MLAWQPPQPSLKEIRREYGERLSDEELLLRYLIPGPDVDAMYAAGRRIEPCIRSAARRASDGSRSCSTPRGARGVRFAWPGERLATPLIDAGRDRAGLSDVQIAASLR